MIETRMGRDEDIPKILDFIKKAGFTERSLESWNGENMEAVIALDKGSIVGAIPFAVRQLVIAKGKFARVGYVSAVSVKDGYRSKGIGSSLLSFIKEEVPELDCLAVNRKHKDGEDRAYKWYIRNGFFDLVTVRVLFAEVSEIGTDERNGFETSVRKVDNSNIDRLDYEKLLKLFEFAFGENGGFERRDKTFWKGRFRYHYYKMLNEYFLLTLSRGDEVVAYTIFAKNFIHEKNGKVDVLEYGFDRSKANVKDLVSELTLCCSGRGIPVMRFVTSDETEAYSQILSLGFEERDNFKFMVLPLKESVLVGKEPWAFLSFDYI